MIESAPGATTEPRERSVSIDDGLLKAIERFEEFEEYKGFKEFELLRSREEQILRVHVHRRSRHGE